MYVEDILIPETICTSNTQIPKSLKWVDILDFYIPQILFCILDYHHRIDKIPALQEIGFVMKHIHFKRSHKMVTHLEDYIRH